MTQPEPDEASGDRVDESGVVELRRYTLHPGRRDTLIALFEREFVEPQEAAGMRLIGQFRDLDAPDRFVWLRGFVDMASRPAALQAFYGGAVWAAHREAANATMIDSDDVLLLRPAWPGATSAMHASRRDRLDAVDRPAAGAVALLVFHLRRAADAALLAWSRDRGTTALREGGAMRQAWLVTEAQANNFARLPVRDGETVLVCIALFADAAALDRLRLGERAMSDIEAALSPWSRAIELQRLEPTPRSALHA